jgi:hypothetical protein
VVTIPAFLSFICLYLLIQQGIKYISVIIYSTPFAPIRKDIFQKIHYFFKQTPHEYEGGGDTHEEEPDKLKHGFAEPQGIAAHGQEIQRPAEEGEDHHENTLSAAAQCQPEEEDRPGADQPEQQIQKGGDDRAGEPPPHRPEQIVIKPRRQPQTQRPRRFKELTGYGELHP